MIADDKSHRQQITEVNCQSPMCTGTKHEYRFWIKGHNGGNSIETPRRKFVTHSSRTMRFWTGNRRTAVVELASTESHFSPHCVSFKNMAMLYGRFSMIMTYDVWMKPSWMKNRTPCSMVKTFSDSSTRLNRSSEKHEDISKTILEQKFEEVTRLEKWETTVDHESDPRTIHWP